jgi:alkaline phosphatase
MNRVTSRSAKLAAALLLLGAASLAAASHARNVILFLGDGTGIPTINATSIYAHGKARALYVQNIPHIGLSETSTTIAWVSDSAAGMTVIVTGHKTKNTVLSQSADAEPGVKDGARKSVDNLAKFDKIIQRTADAWRKNTLLLFTADHSYGLRLAGGRKGQDIVPLVKVEDGHTAEEVLVSAEGPGSQRVKGVMENTELFRVMLSAYGWKP